MGANDPKLGALETVVFENLEQFVDVINRNYAVIQNSPLFRGIPGDDAEPGDEGPQGKRGSKFFFIDFNKFNLSFPNELSSGNQIDLIYINSKLSTAENKLKLFTALNTIDLVDGDIFVLTNSKLLNYNFAENKLHDTNLSFNTSVTDEIQTIIEQMFNNYIPILQASIKNIHEVYSTLGKNYADNNNTGITTNINNTTVFSPVITGITPNIGIPIVDHKFIGFNNSNTPESQNTTNIFGSVSRYYKMLMNTINSDGSQTLTSDYAPGVNNIPTLVLLQDTYNAGLLLGYKNKTNLKNFGSIFKNDNDELVIKSDAGNLIGDNSILKLHKNYMRFNKLVQFNDSLEISHNLNVFGEINQLNFKTGIFAKNTNEFNNQNNTELFTFVGNSSVGSETIFNGEKTRFTNFKDRVLITDTNGYLTTHTTDKTIFADYDVQNVFTNIIQINPTNPRNFIIQAYHFNYLAKKVNTFYNQIWGTFWTKAEFTTGVIPSLHLNNYLIAKGNVLLGSDQFVINVNGSYTNSTSADFNFLNERIKYQSFRNNVMVNDNSGQARKDVLLNENYIPDLPTLNIYSYITEVPNTVNVITVKHYNGLVTYLNSTKTFLINNYWNKSDFETYIIPNITLGGKVVAKKGLVISKANGINWLNDNTLYNEADALIYADANNEQLQIGNSKADVRLNFKTLKSNISRKFLWFDTSGQAIPVSRIGNIPMPVSVQFINTLQNGDIKVADNVTISNILLKQLNDYDSLYNYTNSQINQLNTTITTALNNLTNEINIKFSQIDSSIVDIYNQLALKADKSYVDNQFNLINTNLGNLNTRMNQAEADIIWIKEQLLLKANLSDFLALRAEFDEFKANTVQLPKNTVVLWEGVNGQPIIPTGWEEVISMRGRVAVGWLNGVNDPNTFWDKFGNWGESGGNAKHILTVNEMPKHNHRFRKVGTGTEGGNRWGWVPGNFNETGGNGTEDKWTTQEGNDQPHNNVQPYQVLMYIRSLKGI